MNRFFGYKAVARVKLRQGEVKPPAGVKPAAAPPSLRPIPVELGDSLRDIGDAPRLIAEDVSAPRRDRMRWIAAAGVGVAVVVHAVAHPTAEALGQQASDHYRGGGRQHEARAMTIDIEPLRKQLGRKIEDEDRRINKQLNDDASAIIADLYDNAPCGYHALSPDGRVGVRRPWLPWVLGGLVLLLLVGATVLGGRGKYMGGDATDPEESADREGDCARAIESAEQLVYSPAKGTAPHGTMDEHKMSQAEALYLEAALFGMCCATEDKKEGTTAFLEKRAAAFQGK